MKTFEGCNEEIHIVWKIWHAAGLLTCVFSMRVSDTEVIIVHGKVSMSNSLPSLLWQFFQGKLKGVQSSPTICFIYLVSNLIVIFKFPKTTSPKILISIISCRFIHIKMNKLLRQGKTLIRPHFFKYLPLILICCHCKKWKH